MHPQEIETAVRNELAVIYLVVCDRQWGMVKYGQGMATNPEVMAEKRSLPPEQTLNTDGSRGPPTCAARSSAAWRAGAAR
jgi:acetolactate synthase-1/2/3 large subunit